MTLKTLKDINKLAINTTYKDWTALAKTNDNNFILLERKATNSMKDILKEEAVNWINEMERQIDVAPMKTPIIALGVIDWIKMFFNITEEDLCGGNK